jgi:hypothetical protein
MCCKKSIIVVVVSMLLATLLSAEMIYLKDGSKCEGTIVKEDATSILVETADSWKKILKSDIEATVETNDANFEVSKKGLPKENEDSVAVPVSVVSTKCAIDAGSIMLGGSGGIYNTSISGYSGNVTTIELDPEVGFFVAKGFMVGPKLSWECQMPSKGSSLNNFGFGFKTAYYFGNNNSKTYFHVGLEYMHDIISGNTDMKNYNGNSVIPQIGFDFMLSPKTAVNLGLGYRMYSYSYYMDEYYSVYGYYGYNWYAQRVFYEDTINTVFISLGISIFCF